MLPILILIVFFALSSDQPVLITFSLVSYFSVMRLFWKDGEPKIIFFGLTMFWLSISIKLFYAVYLGVPYESLSWASNIVSTTYSALFCFILFSLGIYAATKKTRDKAVVNFNFNYGYDTRRIFTVFAGSIVGLSIIKGGITMASGFDQIMFSLVDLKIGFLFLLLYPVFKRKDVAPIAVGFIVIEIILSFFSFFSSFKDILFTTLVVLLTPRLKLDYKSLTTYAIVGFVVIYMLATWQNIKDEYRAFLNQGSRSQVIKVSQADALEKLQELATKEEEDELVISEKKTGTLTRSIDRLSYIEFYSESRLKVPLLVPYEQGRIWAANLAHIFMPRIFFPDKGVIDDSQMVNKYCIRRVATAKQGASFSLGFVAESYIDFGPVFMYVIIFLVGYFMGFIYALILRQSINLFWGYCMVVPLHMKIACNGTPGTKILGWMLTYYITFLLFKKFLMKPLDNYLKFGSFSVKLNKDT